MDVSQLAVRTELPGIAAPKPAKDSPEKIRDAASQFEALLIGQVLKSAQSDQQDGLFGGGDEDQSASTAMDYARDIFAKALAARGGLGLAGMITKSLQHAASSETQEAQPTPKLRRSTPGD